MRTLIYLDHNATTPVDLEVLEAMLPYLRTEFGNPSSAHRLGRAAREAVETAREQVAALIGADGEEIVFTSGGTEASQLALLGAAASLRRRRDGGALQLLTFALEHPATLRPLEALRQQGDRLTLVPPDSHGVARLERFRRAWEEHPPDLISLMQAHNETGAIQPVEEVGALAAERGGIFHVDGAQSIGKIPVDVKAIGCHLLSIAGHKLYAAKGAGALYVRKGTEIEPLLPGAGQERGLRGGTENVAGIVALGTACRLAAERIAAGDAAQIAALRDHLWDRLRGGIPGIARTSEEVATLPNTLHVRFPGVTGDAVLAATPEVVASTGSACHAGSASPPAAITALGVEEAEALGSIRLSLGHGTGREAVETAAAVLIRGWQAAGGNPHGTRR